jgi:hypothetical protein
MVAEGTAGKYVLWALHPERAQPVTQTYATIEAVTAERTLLEAAGYKVTVTTPRQLPSD